MEHLNPGWWELFLPQALAVVPRDHGVAEALLGIEALIENGKSDEAKRLALQVQKQIDLLNRNPNIPGEIDSTQLAQMMADPNHSQDLKSQIASRLPELTVKIT